MPLPMNCHYSLNADTLIVVTVVMPLLIFLSRVGHGTCQDIYFPMTEVQLKLPFNEKSQSIFSKIPIGRFEILANDYDTDNAEYLYIITQNNEYLRVNSSSGEIFMTNNYQNVQNRIVITLTAIPRNESQTPNKIATMKLVVIPQSEAVYCAQLENVCFWENAKYRIEEDDFTYADGARAEFKPLRVGALNSRATRYLCPTMNVKYRLLSGGKYIILKDYELYTSMPIDHELLNATGNHFPKVTIGCTLNMSDGNAVTFNKTLDIDVVDRNDNEPVLQNEGIYQFTLDSPHFRENDRIGDPILFTDKDSLNVNKDTIYKIVNDVNKLVHTDCKGYETDHTKKIRTIVSCQILFTRNGILSQSQYCFSLIANDSTVVGSVNKTAKADICLYTDPHKIHDADRPKVLEFRQQPSKRRYLTNSESNNNKSFKAANILINYVKDVYVYRTAMSYSRVAQPDNYKSLIDRSEVSFAIAEDRSGAFGITSKAGIVYVKDTSALKDSPETVYFLNITWHDDYQRSFFINVHLVDGQAANVTCDHKIKSRSQTCAQIKYSQQCTRFCGLGTNGATCMWRGSNAGFFGSNYASCAPDLTHCRDNICDPLEELNAFICPQDCVASNKIMGPHATNNNKRGISSASGTCTCEDNGKCVCAPLDDEEPRPKRKGKNATAKSADINKLSKPNNLTNSTLSTNTNQNNGTFVDDVMIIRIGNYTCGSSCIILALACPSIIFMLFIYACLIRKLFGNEPLSQASSANDDCDVRKSDVPLIQFESTAKKLDSIVSKWEFDRAKLRLDIVLGEGEFGKVMKGYATDIADIPGVTTVAVKTLKNGANSVEYTALLSEFQLLQEVSHPNVIKLLGACTKGDKPMIIIEYAKYGSLRSYLRLSRKIESVGGDFDDGVEPITAKNVLSFAWQICKGMAYLTEIKLVHRDLAARNVLLADGKICKVSDFGLTRDVYEDDAYLKRSRDRVPVKWMAPESLADHVYTTKSDVWAFGVLCWELITLGASPYPGIPPQNIYHLLKTGYRMEKPENCSEEFYAIVRTCWSDDPNSRPSFKYLASQFEKLLGNNAKYIEMESSAISNPMYCLDEAKLAGISQPDLTACLNQQQQEELGEPECLDHLWQPPKIAYDTQEFPISREISRTFNLEFQTTPPPPGYDVPRPVIETGTTGQRVRYENDLCVVSVAANSGNASKGGGVEVESDAIIAHYSVPTKRVHSYTDITNKTFIPDNLDSYDFEKHLSKTISFRFSSLLNLKEQDLGSV